MNRKSLIITLLFAVLSFNSFPAIAQMTDEAVYTYVKDGLENGKSQDMLIQELLAKGVTKEQALRIKNNLEGKGNTGSIREAGVQERMRRMKGTMSGVTGEKFTSLTNKLNDMPDTLFQGGVPKEIIQDGETYVLKEVKDTVFIFGHNIFTNPDLTFEPNENIATPENYKLAGGDELIIDIWGTNEASIRQTISPDGFISIEGLGLVYPAGMTVKEAEDYLRKQLSKIYPVAGANPESEMKLTLGALRTIQVNVMGEVKVPGTYFLSSLSSVYHALYRAGGFTELGSLRSIELIRKGKNIQSIDVYDLLVHGKTADDVILQDGDIVLVPTYEIIVDIAGKVKRPMKYEMKEGENVGNLLGFAGGFKGDAYTRNVNVVRRNGREHQVFTVASDEFDSFQLMDTDSLTVGESISRYENRVEVMGAVYRPGAYQLSEKMNTVSQLIDLADGLMGDAFTNRAIIHRERKDLTLEVISVNLKDIINGTAPDVELAPNDILYVSSIHDINDVGIVTINGEVARPGKFVFAENMTIEDLIIQAGGLLESASIAKVDVSRRIKNPSSNESIDELVQVYTFTIKDGYVIDDSESFTLSKFDQVYIRKSPVYNIQDHVTIEGEVLYPGSYALTKKSMRLSELVKQAGGSTKWAYIEGAKLERRVNDEEIDRLKTTRNVLMNSRDSSSVDKLNLLVKYTVGIDLAAAIAHPGSDADIVLRDGDNLIIPQYDNTVRISGNVMFPNTVSYSPSMKVKDYINMAGGYGHRSKKNQTYVIHMNGTVAKARKNNSHVVKPGSEIVVPVKPENNESLNSFLNIATTSSSIATMLATVYNIIK